MLTEPDRVNNWGELGEMVDRGRQYEHAPIIEAVLDIRVELPDGVGLDRLADLMAGRADYPSVSPQVQFEGGLVFEGESIHATTSGRQIGHLFQRVDQQRVIQAHLDRFVFSWLKPYDEWSKFIEEAEEMWLRYVQAVEPIRVTSAGVRFVNKIVIPQPRVEIKDYLRTSVDVSPYLPQAISSMLLQVSIPLGREDIVATITSTIVPPDVPGSTSLILDIDTVRPLDLSRDDQEFESKFVAALEHLHQAKNLVFEACITDATRGLIG